MPSIRLEIAAAPSGVDPAGLLVPIPPDTLHQQLASFEHSAEPTAIRCQACDSEQGALFVPASAAPHATFEFYFKKADGGWPARHFEPAVNQYVAAAPELVEGIRQLTIGASGEREKLTRIIALTASLFEYDHPPVKFYEGKDAIPLLTQLTKGSCVDINTFLMSALYSIGIPAAYYSGCFFEDGKPPTAHQSHCWVSTYTDGEQQDWDIAHHIMVGRREVKPSLNPKPGTRLAMSCGRGLKFRLGERDVWLPHLGYPFWVLANGGQARAQALATLIEEGAADDLGRRIPGERHEIRV
jgi:hypothetical protein